MNTYATLDDLKDRLGISSTTDDSVMLDILEEISRSVDDFCGRQFYAETATRYFDGTDALSLVVDDLLSVTTLAVDNDGDLDWTDESWTEDTDFILVPFNSFPKTRIKLHPNGSYSFPGGDMEKAMKITGLWGYGDGQSATPYTASSVTATVATTTGTTVTVSADDVIEAGHTILVESEQMFVTAVGTGSFTATRGVNGTTAATHTTKTISTYDYPAAIRRATLSEAASAYTQRGDAGITMERQGDYSYTRGDKQVDRMMQMLGPYRRLEMPGRTL